MLLIFSLKCIFDQALALSGTELQIRHGFVCQEGPGISRPRYIYLCVRVFVFLFIFDKDLFAKRRYFSSVLRILLTKKFCEKFSKNWAPDAEGAAPS